MSKPQRDSFARNKLLQTSSANVTPGPSGAYYTEPSKKELTMTLTRLLTGGILAALLATAAPSPAAPSHTHGSDCPLATVRVTSVTPHRAAKRLGKVALRRIDGATVRVEAKPGLSAEWLSLMLKRHGAAMRQGNMQDCAFDVDGVKIEVKSAGEAYTVNITAPDSERGREVLRRAELLLK